jgi:hypothetical protein
MFEEMMNANKANSKENLKEMREDIKSGQEEMRSIYKAWITDMKKDLKETMSCQVTTETCLESKEINQEDMK